MPAPPPESEPAMMRIRAVGVTLRAFDPFCGAKLSMCTRSSLERQIPRIRSRGRLYGLANFVDEALDQSRILAFGHDPDERLGARLADHETAPALQLRFRGGNPLAHAVRLERLCAAIETDVLEELRERLELAEQLACRSLAVDECSEDLQARDEAIAGRAMIGKDDMPRLLAADVPPARAHFFEHVAVADLRAQQLQARFAKLPLESEIGHDRGDDTFALQCAARLQPEGNQRHQLVAVDQLSLLVGNDQPIGVTVEREPDIGTARDHRFLHQLGMGRAALV